MDNHFERNVRMNLVRKEAQEVNLARHRMESKEKLIKEMEKRVRTTFIGALDSFEKEFGPVIKSDRILSEQWQLCRKEILDKGNNQLRLLSNELKDYIVDWQAPTEHFIFGR